ncbi:MAG: sulfotransferase, partial [Candidatus Nanopelagicales bacterium]
MILPSVIIAGAQKSGTTTLRGMMAQHPDVFMSTPKELHYFDSYYDRGIEWYSSCFAAGASFMHRGESTPFYMYNPTARKRMLTTLPELKVICILRNPIDRAYSH